MNKWLPLSIIVILISCFVASATIINVPGDHTTIQAAIDAGFSGDTILVQPGAYNENIDFNGKNIVLGSLFLTTSDTSYISSTIIDGGSLETVVLFTHNEDSTAALIGFTIQNGVATTYGYGGGIYCYSSDPLISHNRIINNTASSGGGGVCCNYNSHGTIADNFISGNSSTASGGGIFCRQNSNIRINDNIISDNSASNGSGIYCWSNSNSTLNNNTITGNSCNNNGGGIYIYNSSPMTVNSIIWGNSAGGVGDDINIYSGAPVFAYCDVGDSIWPGTGNVSCDPMFCAPDDDNYQIHENSCCLGSGDGGANIGALGMGCESLINVPFDYSTIQGAIDAAFNGDTVLVQPGSYTENINLGDKVIVVGSLYLTSGDDSYISSTIIDGNASESVVKIDGSGSASPEITGFTIQNGLAYQGGGIYCFNSSPLISHNRIIENSATYAGGGIWVAGVHPRIINNIINSNESNQIGGGISCIWTENVEIGYNLIALNGATAPGEGLGGGIYFETNSSLYTYNNTIFGNYASTYGGGIYYNDPIGIGGELLVVNSVLWANWGVGWGLYLDGEATASLDFTDFQGGWPGPGNNFDCDPLFCDPNNGDFHLDVSSCCAGAGEGGVDIGVYGVACGSGGFEYLPGDANMYNGAWPPSVIGGDVTYLVNYFRSSPSSPSCRLNGFYCSADANGDCAVIGSDVTKLVNYFRGQTQLSYCPDYEPTWPTPGDLPEDAPAGWPNCE